MTKYQLNSSTGLKSIKISIIGEKSSAIAAGDIQLLRRKRAGSFKGLEIFVELKHYLQTSLHGECLEA